MIVLPQHSQMQYSQTCTASIMQWTQPYSAGRESANDGASGLRSADNC